ncbi:hypothetical protein [Nocardia gipuzkoensis]|uniref:hypothetical protein n=1 Tax=Nocardia gipuzkoensis TaxID=2749991 RepID=UPI00237E173B|nr:hypothetical protein [Nocardia gipuzkoensis]MDE1672665.1 hypothetical protein [Nocardia gipuzkoensis]
MSRNYVRVIVSNRSSAHLRLRHYSTSGEWTPGGWVPTQSPQIGPGVDLWWQAEGDSAFGVALAGVEARAWYDVVAPSGVVVGELYVFANSPWVESQFGNTFHVHAPPGYYAAYVDAKGQKHGNRAVLEISFRDTRKVAVPGFKPTINGFAFANTWSGNLPVVTLGALWNRFRNVLTAGLADALGIGTLPEDWMPITQADAGLCGGMTYAAMDYFALGQLPPEAKKDSVVGFVSPDSPDDPLFLFIRQRLLDSFDFMGRGHRWLSYTSAIYPDDDEGVLQTFGVSKGKAWVTYREEWPRIRELLDNGKLAPIGLVQSAEFDIGKNHQVLAYAYEQSAQNVKLWIYDPNVPGQSAPPAKADDLYLEFDTSSTSNGITVIRHNAPPTPPEKTRRIYAILLMDNYIPQVPPAGRAVPLPGRPKRFELVIGDAESITTGGTVTGEHRNHCGEIMQTGNWTSRTIMTFVAQLAGYVDPAISWTVGGVPVTEGMTQVTIGFEGATFDVGCRLHPGARSLTLLSGSGETYRIDVTAAMRDALGETQVRSSELDVNGTYEGIRIEHIRAEVQCIARTIPAPVDIGVFVIPEEGPDPRETERWRAGALESLRNDATINPATRAAIEAFVDIQVELPGIRSLGASFAARNRIGG